MSPWASGDSLTPSTLNRVVPSWISSTMSGSYGLHNVKDYGATGDGTTDDTAAITAAAAKTVSPGGILFFPPGTYKVSSSITVPLSTVVQGAGPWLSRVHAASGMSSAVFRSYNTASAQQMVHFRDLRITLSGDADTAIDLTSLTDCLLENVRIEGDASGVARRGIGILCDAGYITAGYCNTLMNCDIQSCGTGIQIQREANEQRIIATRILNNGIGVSIVSGSPLVDGVSLIMADIEGSTTYGLDAAGSLVKVIASRFENNGTADIRFTTGSQGPHILMGNLYATTPSDVSYLGSNTTILRFGESPRDAILQYGDGFFGLYAGVGDTRVELDTATTGSAILRSEGPSTATLTLAGKSRPVYLGTVAVVTDGSSSAPGVAWVNEQTLGFHRPSAGIIQGVGGFLSGNFISSSTTAASGTTARLTNQGQLVFSVLSTSSNGAEFGIRSGNTVYRWFSDAVG